MIVRELVTRLGFSLDNATITRAESATNRLRDRANETANAFRNIFVGLAGIASVRSLIQTADQMQSIRARIEQLPQTVMEAGAAFDVVAERASAARAPIEAYAGLYNRLGNAAKDYITTQEDLLGITDTISKALVVGGATAQEAGSVMIQFSQALGAGTLQGEEFRAMAEAAPQFMDKLAESLGIPRAELKKMASEGKITSKQVIEATRQMADYFDNKFKAMPMTVGQAMTIVGNRFSRMIDKMNRDSMFVTRIATTILDVFDKIEKGLDFVIEKFGGWENAIRFLGAAIATIIGVKAIQALVALNATLAPILIKWALIAAGILLVAAIIEDLYIWVSGEGESLTGNLIGPWSEWSAYVLGAFAMIKDAVIGLGKYVGALAAMLVGVFTMDWNLIKEGYKGQVEILSNALNPAIEAYKPGTWSLGASSAMGNMRPSVNSNTTVNVTVPPGTPSDQAAFLEKSANIVYQDLSNKKLATDMGAYAQ